MKELPTISWTFDGSAPNSGSWPYWMVWMNFGSTEEKIVMHMFEGEIVAYKGDTIHRDSVGRVFVIRGQSKD